MKAGHFITLFFAVIVIFLAGYGFSHMLEGEPEVVQQEAVAAVVTPQTIVGDLLPQQQQLPTFTDDSGMTWTVVDTIWAEFSDYKFLQGLIVRNTEGQQATLNQDANLLFLIALANSSDPGIWEVLDAYGVRISDMTGKQLYPIIIP